VQTSFIIAALLAISSAAFSADFAPSLQWVKTSGGSGTTIVTGAASDSHGNLFIVGSTTSLDFPTTTGALQSVSGSSMLVRINLASASATRLYPANLPPIDLAVRAPSDAATLYAASITQIFKSTDSGANWTMTHQFPSGTSLTSLAVDPTAAGTVYATNYYLGIQKSIDGGITWTPANNGLASNPNGVISATGIFVEPSAPQTLLATGGFGLARSTDGAQTWTLTGNPANPIVFDPVTPTTVYTFSLNTVYKSADNGQTFLPLPSLPLNSNLLVLTPDPRHQGVLFAGTTAGIYQSIDAGQTWTHKNSAITGLLVADPNSSAFYANSSGYGILKTTDGFATTSTFGPNEPSIIQILVSGPNLFEFSSASMDAFALKLDNNGNVVYSTYLGGTGSDAATALAVGNDGSLYVAGSTNSADFPVTPGVYLSTLPSTTVPAGFVLKLNPTGSLEWSTYFPERGINAIAVDAAGEPFIGGTTSGGLPTTPGVYQAMFQQSVTSNGFFAVIGPLSAFVTKFNSKGSGLVYSTYVPTDNQKNIVGSAQALVVDASGNVWMGVGNNSGIVPSGPSPSVVELNPSGSALLASAMKPSLGAVASLALDAASNVYIAGSFQPLTVPFPATPGAFQSVPQPAAPTLPYQVPAGGGLEAFVAKWDPSLTHLLAATLIGGEQVDSANSVALDASGNVIVSGNTGSRAFPTHAPFQELFASQSGFVAGFDSNLSSLLFSTYLGDSRSFSARAVVPDGNGNILIAGSTSNPSNPLGNILVANKIALPPAPSIRLDSIQNFASHLASPIAPGETVMAIGSGFAGGAQLVIDGSPLATISSTATSLVAAIPLTAATSGVHAMQVSQNESLSNPVYVPAAPASPGIYSSDNSGEGQAYIFNSDGTLNSPSNPAAVGSAITIFATGAGAYTLSGGYAVTSQFPTVLIDGFYCNGISATIGPVEGIPGDVFRLSVYVPDPAVLAQNNPDLKNFNFPAQSGIQLLMGPTSSQLVSQNGVFINIK
jgi:uncharacterized protein (TIGR03437 family)